MKRSLQELRLELRATAAERTNELCRMPSDAEFALHLDVRVDEVREARQADLAFQAASLDSPVTTQDGSASLGDMLGA